MGSDEGAAFVAQARTARTAAIQPGSPWDHGYGAQLNARFRGARRTGEPLSTLHKAQIFTDGGHRHHNTKRPHSAPGYRPPPDTPVPGDRTPVPHAEPTRPGQPARLSGVASFPTARARGSG
ncbi:hypothetical protein DXV76_09295 [Rhodobacteraceae bacterium CCMM004]|nr:hypothetical protein DXV76_09295 [Rhodobacteraceae bacterium CCMM004]